MPTESLKLYIGEAEEFWVRSLQHVSSILAALRGETYSHKGDKNLAESLQEGEMWYNHINLPDISSNLALVLEYLVLFDKIFGRESLANLYIGIKSFRLNKSDLLYSNGKRNMRNVYAMSAILFANLFKKEKIHVNAYNKSYQIPCASFICPICNHSVDRLYRLKKTPLCHQTTNRANSEHCTKIAMPIRSFRL